MSKERLEEFREFVDFMYESIDIEDHQRFIAISDSMLNDGWFKWIYLYAKEQAERVQELETVIEQDKRQSVLEGLYEQNKRYREALFKMDDYDIELGDMREDMQEKLLQIKYIKDKALEE